MILNNKTIEKLQKLINSDDNCSRYRSGPQLVNFFNNFGFHDSYGQGFPSRRDYTLEKLKLINGTPEIDKCIKILFAPINYIGEYDLLKQIIDDFNQYLNYDGWKVVWVGKEIIINKSSFENLYVEKSNSDEKSFLEKDFSNIDILRLNIESSLFPIIKQRLDEIAICIENNAALSVIFLCGSTLEGVLTGIANRYPKKFNTSKACPRDKDENVRPFYDWTLANFIDVAYEIGLIDLDVKKYSHSLRDFRNFIHPYEQMVNSFNPTIETAKISVQVLKAAIDQLCKNN